MKRLNPKGFTVVEILLVLVVLSVLGGVGYVVYNKSQDSKPQESQAPADNSATDSTNTLSYTYPADWQLKPYVWEDCCDGPPKTEPDWNVVAKPIVLLPPGIQPGDSYANEQSSISINFIDTSTHYGRVGTSKNFEELKASILSDPWFENSFETVTINGREWLYNRTDYLGPPDAKVESFIDHRYYIFNEGKLIEVYFLEKHHHDWHPEQEVDNSQYKDEFESIARSIKFL